MFRIILVELHLGVNLPLNLRMVLIRVIGTPARRILHHGLYLRLILHIGRPLLVQVI
jgi:hypothetical protein